LAAIGNTTIVMESFNIGGSVVGIGSCFSCRLPLVTFAPFALLAGLALGERCRHWDCNGVAFVLSGVAWAAVVTRADYILRGWRCPRCGQAFFRTYGARFRSVNPVCSPLSALQPREMDCRERRACCRTSVNLL